MAVQEKRIIIIYAFAKVRIKDFTYLRDLLLMGLGGAMGERYDVRDFRSRNLERMICHLSSHLLFQEKYAYFCIFITK